MSPFDFQDKVVLITGAGGGIGRAAALAFARGGARVMATDLSAPAAQLTAGMIREAGGDAQSRAVDVTRSDQVAAMVDATVQTFGGLDCAFNNAGVEEENDKITDVDEALFERIMAINVKGVWLCMKHQLAVMAAQGSGSIINTASVAGLIGAPKRAAYAASKHAVVGMTKSVAAEYARRGIRVNTVCPGIIRTAMMERAIDLVAQAGGASQEKQRQFHAAMHPMGRVGEANEVVNAVLWLASDASSFVTGHQLAVDGGLTAL
jgi:NAD(P)-dependent dehydrogenase (short-subunit alcohol dehydrogenase family)